MKIAFLGTPEFALPSLEMLLECGHELCVFTQPDRPKGRGYASAVSPVKEFALSQGLCVMQFEKIRSEDGVAALKSFAPELMVTAAFGQLLSKENLAVPKHGCINVHGSLLPKYRGAAPIQWAIINGEKTTGITTMQTDAGLDTGDMLLKRETEIGADETALELYARLSRLGADTLKETIAALESGQLAPIKQNEAESSYFPPLSKAHGKVDFTKTSQAVHDLVRGANPWPGAFATLGDTTVKLWKTRPAAGQGEPGRVTVHDGGMFVGCAGGLIEILELQWPGGKRLCTADFLRGRNIHGALFE